MTTAHRFAALDSLRGIAALGVAAAHLNAATPVFRVAAFRASALFVYFFFVLSGFVIAANYAGRLQAGMGAARFLWLRVWRVYPVHLAALAAYVLVEIAALMLGSGVTGRSGFSPPRTLEGLAATALLLQSLYPPAINSWLGQSWSVSVEMVLYVLAAMAWPRLGRWWWVAGIAAAALAAWLDHGAIGDAGYSGLLRGITGFGLGAVVYPLWNRWGSAAKRVPGALGTVAEAAALIAIALIMQAAGGAYFGAVFALDLLFAATVLIFAAQRGALSRLLLRPLPLLVGTVSYSLYMIHPLAESIVLTLLQRAAALAGHADWFVRAAGTNRPVPAPALGIAGDGIAVLVLAVCVGAAWVMWGYIEDPCRRWSRDRTFLAAPRVLSAGA